MIKLRNINYRHYICLAISLSFMLLAVFSFPIAIGRIIEGCRDFGISFACFFCELFKIDNNLIVTVNNMPKYPFFDNTTTTTPPPTTIIPDNFNDFKVDWHNYWELWTNKDNFINYIDLVHRFSFIVIQFIAVLIPFTAYNKRDSHYKSKEDQTLALVKAVKEVCKYITKFEWTEEEPRRVRELVDTLKGKRQYTVWGVLSDIRKQVNYLMDSKPDDELEDFVCQVCGCTKAHPNKVYSAIWHDDNFFIKDYATTPPKYIASDSLVETIRQRNNAVKHQDLNAIARVPEKPKSQYVQQEVMPEDAHI